MRVEGPAAPPDPDRTAGYVPDLPGPRQGDVHSRNPMIVYAAAEKARFRSCNLMATCSVFAVITTFNHHGFRVFHQINQPEHGVT